MSSVLIQQYLAELAKLRQVGGTHRESVVREAFKDLLKGWGRALDLTFVPEYEIESPAKERRYVDGALVYGLRLPFGYWEAKDERDDLDAEIELKFKRGYPQDNIVFEDSREAVLIQNRREVIRCAVDDVEKLQRLLELYFGYERPEIAEFRKAVEQFKADLPAVCDALRGMIERAYSDNATFRAAADKFLKQARETINPSLGEADVREILIQHILTEEIFALVFPGSNYHEDNNIARELYKLEHTFFTGNTKHQTLRALEPYYAAIRRSAGQIASHHEKQTFLKVVYENFYKVYNPKAADRLGVVYTPNEIVRFMIESADWLCEKHFGRNLIDRDVEILDPAAGTGTFISELLEHFRGQPAKLKHKYLEELHANEVAILPYYVANLNIEATYAAISGEYLEYPNLCFVDTLDNVAGLRRYTGQQVADLFGMGEENVERIKRQNRRKISVVIGNPPYNANQANENDNNKNREYPDIDARIKDTYIKASTAQKTKLYDMYARFFRWASDRVAENGVVAFISNRSYIDSRTFDGFRDVVAREFNEIHIVDLGGDVRANPKLSGTKHNVFGIQTGVAIGFLVKRAKAPGCRIFYSRRPEFETAEEKLAWLSKARFDQVERTEIRPDTKHNWLNLTDNDFDSLLPVASKAAKAAKKPSQEKAIFKLFSLGVVTNRDEWAYADDKNALAQKMRHFCAAYEAESTRWKDSDKKTASSDFVDRSIKWTSELESHMKRGTSLVFDQAKVVESLYRPFVQRWTYFAPVVTHRPYQNFNFFPSASAANIGFSFAVEERSDFGVIATTKLPNKDMFIPSAAQFVCLYRYDENGNRIENITDWALKQFRDHYGTAPPPQPSPAGGGSKSIQPPPAGGGSRSSQPPSAGGRGESIQPPPAGEGSKSSQPPSAGGRGESIQPPPAGEGSSTTQPIPPGRGRKARILRAATASISKSSPVMDGSEAQSHSGGGSAGFDSLPQRGRVGEGEPQASTLFIPKPLPANLKARARELRGNLTDAEKLVWSMLRKEQMGVKFRRQHPDDPYVLDFYCVERKLAVEIDGGQHNEVKGREHDERRTIFLQDKGIRVLRFWNNEVSENPEGVWDAIVEALKGAPPPQPSPAGGGGKADERSGGESEVQSPGNERGFYSLPQRGRAGVGEGRRTRMIDKQDIFHYVYAVLHDPVYREKYAQNLKREFPRIPFYPDFWRWAEWGKTLMDLHIGYESVEPWPLARTDIPDEKARKNGASPKAMLKADKDNGRIVLDTETTLAGIPREAWDYKLGNRSALEWILDQYKEKKPKDPTIRERFNTYRFADYKDKVIDLLARVTRVSVETQAIVEAMRAAPRTP